MVMIPGGGVSPGELKAVPLPEATYTLRIDKAEIKKADGEDKYPYVNLTLTIVDDGEHLGRKIWDILSLKPGATFKLRQLLEDALEWPEDRKLEDTDELLKEEVKAACTMEAGKDGYDDRPKVVKYLARS